MKKFDVTKKYLLSGVAAIGLSGALLVGGLSNSITPVYAEAIRVEAPQTPSFADVVDAVSPAVVSVRVKSNVRPASARYRDSVPFGFDQLPENFPFKRFFESPNEPGAERQNRKRRFGNDGKPRPRNFGISQGSGFLVSDDGYIVTNNHVVENGSQFTVVMNDGKEQAARLIGTDPKTDLAVLKIDIDEKLDYVSFSDKKSRVGEWVVAVGNPFGLGGTVTAGIVSAKGRDIGSGPYDDFIQIDAAVNKGNSGGPAFNLNGEVIGVNTAIFSPSGGNVGIAFAISADTTREVVNDLIKNGKVTRGWLGVQIQPVTKDIAESLGLAEAKGAIVAEAQSGSPAEKAGIIAGDVILSVGNEKIKDPKQLARVIANYSPQDIAEISVHRSGLEKTLNVKLGLLPGSKQIAASSNYETNKSAAVELDELGLSVTARNGNVVVDDVFEGGEALKKGLKPGDVIVSVNGSSTNSVGEFGKAIELAFESERKAVLLQVQSGERNRFVALPIARS